jgi:hypothetical protein
MNDQIKDYVNKRFDELKEKAEPQIYQLSAWRPEQTNPEIIFQAILKQAAYERHDDEINDDVIDCYLCL